MRNVKTQELELSHPRIFEAQALKLELESLRAKNTALRVVFTNGCYDILHPGHVDLLVRAKTYGDVLVLALNTDNSVRKLDKGSDRPINTLEVRAFMAANLACVDYVTSFDEDTPFNIIQLIKPDFLIKGGDWPVNQIVGNDIVSAYGGQVLSLPLLGEYSTTKFLERIRKSLGNI